MDYVLGVDAGNTKTIALLVERDGTIAGAGRAGCGDIYGAESAEAALAEVEVAVGAALDAAGARREAISHAIFSAAGADWPEDFEFLRTAMEERGLGRRVTILNDAFGALRAGSPDGNGVVVVCGTGVAIGARAPDGRMWHTSHWQEPHGTQQLGEKTLRAVYRAELGIDPPTTLTGRVLDYFGVSAVEEVLHRMTARVGRGRVNVRGVARALLDEAAEGDGTARRMVVEHGAALGDYALTAARRVGLESGPFTLVLAGGILRHRSTLLSDSLVARVRAAAPAVRPLQCRFEPVVGATMLALEAAGIAVDDGVLQRLTETMPPTALFET